MDTFPSSNIVHILPKHATNITINTSPQPYHFSHSNHASQVNHNDTTQQGIKGYQPRQLAQVIHTKSSIKISSKHHYKFTYTCHYNLGQNIQKLSIFMRDSVIGLRQASKPVELMIIYKT